MVIVLLKKFLLCMGLDKLPRECASVERFLDLLPYKSLFIFDFDGTLANTSPIHEEAFTAILSQYRHRFEYAKYAGLSTRDVLLTYFRDFGVELPDQEIEHLIVEKQVFARTLISEGLTMMPDAKAFVYLAKADFRLAIATSGSSITVHSCLDQLQISELFELVVCTEDVAVSKPDPATFRLISETLRVPAHNCLVFEDADSGFTAANAAGMDFINVNQLTFRQLHECMNRHKSG